MNHSLNEQAAIESTQRGVALVFALVVLLLLSIIGIAAINTTTLQEKMAGNMRDKNVSMQAADSAVRAGETWISSQTTALAFMSLSGPIAWGSIDWSSSEAIDVTGLQKVASDPKYFIENLDRIDDTTVLPNNYAPPPATYVHRVTGRGVGSTSVAVSMTQSTHEIRR